MHSSDHATAAPPGWRWPWPRKAHADSPADSTSVAAALGPPPTAAAVAAADTPACSPLPAGSPPAAGSAQAAGPGGPWRRGASSSSLCSGMSLCTSSGSDEEFAPRGAPPLRVHPSSSYSTGLCIHGSCGGSSSSSQASLSSLAPSSGGLADQLLAEAEISTEFTPGGSVRSGSVAAWALAAPGALPPGMAAGVGAAWGADAGNHSELLGPNAGSSSMGGLQAASLPSSEQRVRCSERICTGASSAAGAAAAEAAAAATAGSLPDTARGGHGPCSLHPASPAATGGPAGGTVSQLGSRRPVRPAAAHEQAPQQQEEHGALGTVAGVADEAGSKAQGGRASPSKPYGGHASPRQARPAVGSCGDLLRWSSAERRRRALRVLLALVATCTVVLGAGAVGSSHPVRNLGREVPGAGAAELRLGAAAGSGRLAEPGAWVSKDWGAEAVVRGAAERRGVAVGLAAGERDGWAGHRAAALPGVWADARLSGTHATPQAG